MTPLDPSALDLASLVSLAASSTDAGLLETLRTTYPGVRVSHGYVFQHLVDGPRTVGALAAALGMTQQGASKAVLELEELGFVERTPDPHDNRVRHVALSARGRALVDRARAARADLEASILAKAGARDLAAAKRVLVAMLSHAGSLDDVRRRRARPPAG